MGTKLNIFIAFVILLSVGVYHFNQEDKFEQLRTQHKFKLFKDELGIPRIYAKDRKSVFYALGFAEAQDRLWNLHLKKKIFQGRLSQIFGSEAFELDLENRNYDFVNVGKMNAKILAEEQKSQMQAFCDGINDYAKNTNFLPFEFYLTFTEWEDWKIQDSMSMLALLSFVLEFDWMYELARQRLLETVGFNLAWKMMPFGDDNLFREVTIINNQQLKEQGKYVEYDSSLTQGILRRHWLNKTLPIGSIHMPQTDYDSLGSNAWVVGGNHTKKGKPLLANDPHLGLLIPSLFYMCEINIVDENNQVKWSAFGAKADGFPALSIGLNGKFAWGSTASYVDNKDVFHETVRDNNGTLQYLYKQKWIPFRIRKQVFNVRGKGEIVKNYYHTHRGPVIQHLFMDIHVKYGFPISNHYRINHTLTLQSAIYTPDATSFEGLTNLAFSMTFQEFQHASSLILAPNIDSVFITDNGTYGYGAVGRTPLRKIPEMGGFVKDGSTDLYDMGEFMPFVDMPKLRDSKKGYISMANNKFAEDSQSSRSSIHELTTGRSYRLDKIFSEKIKNNHKFSHQDMKTIQLDTRDQFLSEAFPVFLKALETVKHIWSSPQTQKYFSLLKKWDYHMPTDSIQSSIYHVFEHHFHQTLLKDTSLGAQQRQAILNHAFFEIYFMKLYERIGNFNLTEEQRAVCNSAQVNNYTDIHPCLANAALTFKKLPQLLQQLFGTNDHTQYQWSKIHKNVFKSVPWSDIPVLKKIWGRETPAGGNSRTVNVAILTHQTKSYNSIAGPVFRFITDLQETYFSIDTGQSDRVASKFYDNFLGKDMYVKYTRHNPLKGEQVPWEVLIDRL